MTVKEELKKLGLHYVNLDLGMVEIIEDIPQARPIRARYRTGLESGLYRNKVGLKAGENVFLQTSLVAVFRASNSAIQMR
jgi:hypothetical protein